MGKLINESIQVFNKVVKGALITIGNTCTVVGDSNNQVKEFFKPNGEYITNWNEVGSNSYLELPKDCTIKYAILEWHSTIANSDLRGIMKSPYDSIEFTTPTEKHKLEVDKDSSNQAEYIYSTTDVQSVKWIDVTELIKASKSGYYTVEKIPVAPLNNLQSHNQVASWSLSVVYENPNMSNRSISINIGIQRQNFVTPRDIRLLEITGFKVPTIPRKSYLTIVASNGSPNFYSALNIYNDKSVINNITLEYSVGNFTECRFSNPNTTPIVPHDNVFSGIIMNTDTESLDYGSLNTKGTLGDKNNNPFNTLNQASCKGNRGKLDILSFDISEKMYPNQESLFMVTEIWNPNKAIFIDIILYSVQIDTDEEITYEFIQPELEINDNLQLKYTLNENLEYIDEDINKIKEEIYEIEDKNNVIEEIKNELEDLEYSSNGISNTTALKDDFEIINIEIQDEDSFVEEMEYDLEDFDYTNEDTLKDDFETIDNEIEGFDYSSNLKDVFRTINNEVEDEISIVEEVDDALEDIDSKDKSQTIEYAFEGEDKDEFEEIEDIFEGFDYDVNVLGKENDTDFKDIKDDFYNKSNVDIEENNLDESKFLNIEKFNNRENIEETESLDSKKANNFNEELSSQHNLKNVIENINESYEKGENKNLNLEETADEINSYSDLKTEDVIESFSTTNNIVLTKTSDKNTYQINDTITFSIQITNNSSQNIDNVILVDNIPINSSLVANSLTLSGTVIVGNSLPINGVTIGTITPNTTINIVYQVKFYSPPFTSTVQVNPEITFTYKLSGIDIPSSLVGTSNVITIISDPIEIIELFANRNDAISGDVVTYSLVITNNGERTATNVKILDNIPVGLNFVANSLIVNGTSITGDLTTGVIIPDIPPNSQTLVTFEVKVI